MEILRSFDSFIDLQNYFWGDNYFKERYDIKGNIVPIFREEKNELILDIPSVNYKFKIEKAIFRYAKLVIEDYYGNNIATYLLNDILTVKP